MCRVKQIILLRVKARGPKYDKAVELGVEILTAEAFVEHLREN